MNDAPKAPRKILLLSLAGIGDAMCALALAEELRLSFPCAEVDGFVTWSGAADIYRNHPAFRRVYEFNMLRAGAWASLRFCRRLRRAGYDVSINTFPQSKGAYRVVAWLIGARRRLSHSYANCGWLDDLWITDFLPARPDQHLIENNLNLLALLEARPQLAEHDYGLRLSEANRRQADEFIAARGLAGRTLVGLHVGSGRTKNLALRRWPLEHYRELIRLLGERHPRVHILLFGGPDEAEEHRALHAILKLPTLHLIETERITDTAAIVERCHFFVSVDTALMHLAAATKVPHQIVIASPTHNRMVEPYRRPYQLIGGPPPPSIAYAFDGRGIQGQPADIEAYLRGIRPETVLAAMEKHLVAAQDPR
jgi:ADP-heptose:LPS heptosyltransferase